MPTNHTCASLVIGSISEIPNSPPRESKPLLQPTLIDHPTQSLSFASIYSKRIGVDAIIMHDNQIVTLHFSWQTKTLVVAPVPNFRTSHRGREHNESQCTVPSRMVRVASTLRHLFLQWRRDGLGPVPE
jgi:hypothetical protein